MSRTNINRNGMSKKRPTRHRKNGWRNTRDVTAVVREILSVRQMADREALVEEAVRRIQGLLELTPKVHTMNPTHIRRRIYDSLQAMDYLRIVSVMTAGKERSLQWNGTAHIYVSERLSEKRPTPIPLAAGKTVPPTTPRQAVPVLNGRGAKREAGIALEETPEMSPTAIEFVSYEGKLLHNLRAGRGTNSTGEILPKAEKDIASELFQQGSSDVNNNTGSGKPDFSEEDRIDDTQENRSERCKASIGELSFRRDRIAKKKRNRKDFSTRLQNLEKLTDMNKCHPAPQHERILLPFAFIVPGAGSTELAQRGACRQRIRLTGEKPLRVLQSNEIVEYVLHGRYGSTKMRQKGDPAFHCRSGRGAQVQALSSQAERKDDVTWHAGLNPPAECESSQDYFQFKTVGELMDHLVAERESKAFLRRLRSGEIWWEPYLEDEAYLREDSLPDQEIPNFGDPQPFTTSFF